jgi:hypothetical protein
MLGGAPSPDKANNATLTEYIRTGDKWEPVEVTPNFVLKGNSTIY